MGEANRCTLFKLAHRRTSAVQWVLAPILDQVCPLVQWIVRPHAFWGIEPVHRVLNLIDLTDNALPDDAHRHEVVDRSKLTTVFAGVFPDTRSGNDLWPP